LFWQNNRIGTDEQGVALVEFAIVVPILVLLVIGLIEVGRFTSYGIRLSNAAHAGATYGISRTAGQNAILSANVASAACSDSGFTCTSSTPAPGHTASPDTMYISSSLSCSYSDGTVNSACPLPSAGISRSMFIQVSTSASFKPLLKLPLMPNAVPMSANAVMQVGQ
jgi:Flp pilus assembly protein TadG